MKYRRPKFQVIASLVVTLSTLPALAVTKGDNTNLLNLGTSWTGGTAPASTSIADWSGAYNIAGSLSAAFTASTPVSWQGITVGNITGTAAGLVSIGGTGNALTGSSVTIGSSGMDMSVASQNLVLNSATTVLTGSTQTWNVASGRNLRFGTTGTGGANANLDGTAGTVVTVTGGGVVDLNQGGASGFTDAAGFAGFNGKWTVNAGTTLRGLRNGATAWGTGTAADTITLNGGTLAVGGISGAVGNWTWNTNVTVSAASTIDNQNISGSARFLKLNGILAGASNLAFASTGAGTMSADTGFILTAANTLSGTVNIGSGVFVRVGGVNGAGGTDITTTVGSNGDLGTAAIVNNGTLTLSRDNTWTFANNVSGSGLLRIGLTTGSATHIVTVSGSNTHTGGTTLQSAVTLKIGSSNALGTGAFTITGNGVFDNATGSALTVPNTLVMSGGSPTFTGTSDLAFGGLATIGGAATRTITVNGSTLTLAGGTAEDVAGRALSKAGPGTLVLSGTGAHTGATNVNGGTLILAGGAALADTAALTLANTAGVTLQLNSSETVGNLTGGGTAGGTVAVGSNTLTVNSPAGVQILGAGVTGTGAVVKEGTGALTLEGSNSFSGSYSVNNGSLAFRGVDSENGSPAITLGASGILSLGSGFVGQTATISSLSGSGTVTPQFDAALGTKTLGVNQSGDTVFSGTLTDATDLSNRLLALSKSGAGSLTLSGSNAYSGGTTVLGGTVVAGSATAFGTGPITLSTGATLNLNSQTIGNPITNNGGTISGGTLSGTTTGTLSVTGTLNTAPTASFTGQVTVGSGGLVKGTGNFTGGLVLNSGSTVSPGNSPGILGAGNTSWNGGGSYVWEVNNATGSAGANFDLIAITGTLDLAGASSSNPFVVKVASLQLADNLPGLASNFSAGFPGHTWTIVSTSLGVSNFTSGSVTVDVSGFANAHLGAGFWSVEVSGVNLNLVYVPEPSACAALGGLLALGLAVRRRR